jgi:hypothetical protein
MAGKLIGAWDIANVTPASAGYILWERFQAEYSGTMDQFRIKMLNPGNVKCAIYTDNSGSAETVINSIGSTAASTGWNTLSFPATTIVAGTYYWLAVNSETNSTIYLGGAGTGSAYYAAMTYTNSFPSSPTGTAWGIRLIVAGWDSTQTGIPNNLLGIDYGSQSWDIGASYLIFAKFTATLNGIMSQFRLTGRASGNIKCGLYSDNAGEPGTLLNASGGISIASGYNILSFPETAVNSGITYWLAVNSDTANIIGAANTGGTARYGALTFANSFPTNPSGLSSINALVILAGWGGAGGGEVTTTFVPRVMIF